MTHINTKHRWNKDGTLDRRYKSGKEAYAKQIKYSRLTKIANKRAEDNKKRNILIFKISIIAFLLAVLFGYLGANSTLANAMVQEKTVVYPYGEAPERTQVVVNLVREKTIEEIVCSYDWDCEVALRVANCESDGMNIYAVFHEADGTYSKGLWQINDVHNISDADRFDPVVATEHAFRIWQSQGFMPWGCYSTSRYLLPQWEVK